jgi:hypothetical protein
VFGHDVLALGPSKFGWSVPSEARWARGTLNGVAGCGIDRLEATPLSLAFEDFELPLPGSGWFYLVRPDCAVGSWQSTLGEEPVRDVVLP